LTTRLRNTTPGPTNKKPILTWVNKKKNQLAFPRVGTLGNVLYKRPKSWMARPRPLEYSDSNKERNSSPSHGTEHTKNLPYRVQTRSQRHTTHEPQQVAIGTNQTAKRNILGVGPATILRGAPKQAASNEDQDKRQPPITQPQQARGGGDRVYRQQQATPIRCPCPPEKPRKPRTKPTHGFWMPGLGRVERRGSLCGASSLVRQARGGVREQEGEKNTRVAPAVDFLQFTP